MLRIPLCSKKILSIVSTVLVTIHTKKTDMNNITPKLCSPRFLLHTFFYRGFPISKNNFSKRNILRFRFRRSSHDKHINKAFCEPTPIANVPEFSLYLDPRTCPSVRPSVHHLASHRVASRLTGGAGRGCEKVGRKASLNSERPRYRVTR